VAVHRQRLRILRRQDADGSVLLKRVRQIDDAAVYHAGIRRLRQAGKMTPETRARLASALAGEAAPYVSPLPQVPAELFLAGVAAVRRDREYSALMLQRARLERLQPVLTGRPHRFPDR
jgi:hypothetical protein